MSIRVIRIRLKNILAFDDIELAPGKAVLLVQSANGLGKTSLIESLRNLLGGGHDASLLRAGAESGEMVLDLADDHLEGPIHITKTVTESKSRVVVEHPEMGRISSAQGWLDKLIPQVSLSPVAFLVADDKQRLEMLLAALPLSVTSEQIAEITGQPGHIDSYKFPCQSQHALVVLDSVEKAQYDQRTGVNRSLKDKKSSISELRKTLPEDAGEVGDWSTKVEALQQELVELTAEHTAALGAVEERQDRAKHAAAIRRGDKRTTSQAELTAEMDRLKADEEREITEIRAKYKARNSAARDAHEARVGAAQSEYDEAVAAADGDALLAREDVSQRFEPRQAALAEDLGTARSRLEAEAGYAKTRQILERMEREAATLDGEAARLTAAVEGIRQLRSTLTATLPIQDLAVADGELTVNGIPWRRVNEAKRIEIACEVALLRSGKVRMLLLDGGERLDARSLALLAAEIERRECQAIITKVTDDPALTVTEFHVHAGATGA